MTTKQTATLRKWLRIPWMNTITGEVYDHPRFADGTRVVTSSIVKDEGNTVETLNTVYTLDGEEGRVGDSLLHLNT